MILLPELACLLLHRRKWLCCVHPTRGEIAHCFRCGALWRLQREPRKIHVDTNRAL